jgi:carboxyl-terminal processing protease
VYSLGRKDGGPGLALTTQKWFTPSGRLIQRDYSHISQFDYYNHRDNPELRKTEDIKKSDHGRLVYGGGGIKPDYEVAEAKLNPFQESLTASFGVFTFVHQKFLIENPIQDAAFRPSDAALADFKAFLRSPVTAKPLPGPGLKFTEKDFSDNLDFITVKFRQEVLYSLGYLQDAARVALEIDPQVQRAIELIPEAKTLRGQLRNIAGTPGRPIEAGALREAAQAAR